MNTILMCGTENGTETIDMLLAAIEAAHFGAVYICENTVSVIPPVVSPAITVGHVTHRIVPLIGIGIIPTK